MEDTLYIIGNGFDLYHKLPTAYVNFKRFAGRKNSLNKWLNDAYGPDIIQDDSWWSDFEIMLSNVNYANLIKTNNGEAIAADIIKNINNNLSLFFGNWIKQVNNSIDINIPPLEEIDPSSLFITFNYTTLLEKLYHVNSNNIWHIHGSVDDFEKNQKAIIVGHDSNPAQIIKYSNNMQHDISPAFKDAVNLEILKGVKQVYMRIERNNERFLDYTNISHYIAMGFSFNEIDMPYIKKLAQVNRNIEDAIWTIYWHQEGEDCTIKKQLKSIGITDKNIHTIQW
jgi:hypothetical protein